jgi:hypothetical protein
MPNKNKCLIVERHGWETGGGEQQIQLPLNVAEQFFGSGATANPITVRVFLPSSASSPSFEKRVSVSKVYTNGTRRINGFAEIGDLGSCFIFFEETSVQGIYNVWWDMDKAIIAAKFKKWEQAGNSQYGRGRLAIIVDAPVPRQIEQI